MALGLVILLAACSQMQDNGVQLEPQAALQNLGSLGGTSYGWGISDNGLVAVGSSYTADYSATRAVRYTATGEIQILASLGNSYDRAEDASADGSIVVGESYTSGLNTHAVRWDAAGNVQDLGTLGGSSSSAFGVSPDGSVVVGYSNTAPNNENRAFRWTAAGGMEDLGTLGGASYAYAVSADGSTIVGGSETPSGDTHAFIWTEADGMWDIGTLGGSSSVALDVSANGLTVVGYSDLAGDLVTRAFRTTTFGDLEDLGALGDEGSAAYGVSADGSVVVGETYTNYLSGGEPEEHGFVWTAAGRMQDLGTLGGDFSSASAVSSDGKVVVGRSTNAERDQYAVRWRMNVAATSQTISFTSNPPAAGTAGGIYSVSATASSGLPVSFSSATTSVCTVSGSTVRLVAAGSCTVRANQGGNALYQSAPTVSQTFNVGAATGSATYTANFTTAPVGRIISSIKLGQGVSSTSGRATGSVGLSAIRKDKSGNMAMVASSARHFIISKDGTAQTSYSLGGTMDFKFGTFGTGKVTAKSIKVKSTTTTGGTVRVYRGSTLVKTVSVPKTGVGVIKSLALDVTSATLLRVTLTGSGAVDDLVFIQ